VADASTETKSTAYLVSANYAAVLLVLLLCMQTRQLLSLLPEWRRKDDRNSIGASYDLAWRSCLQLTRPIKWIPHRFRHSHVSQRLAPFGASTVVLSYAKGTMTAQARTWMFPAIPWST